MSSHAITSTPVDLVDTASLAAGSTYSLQCSGDYEIELHQDEAGTLTADTVRGMAGPRPIRLLPATHAREPGSASYTGRAGERLWMWAPGLPGAIAIAKGS